MASIRTIKRRIKSAKNVAQITRAMQMVAASKMKKAQSQAVSGRPYAEKISEMVAKFVPFIEPEMHPLLQKSTTGKSLVVLISTNKGLCGGLNTNLFRSLNKWLTQESISDPVFVTLGKKGETVLVQTKKQLQADFSAGIPMSHIPALTTLLTQGFTKGEFKEVVLVFNNFISALRQEPLIKRILPISNIALQQKSAQAEENPKSLDFVVEPGIDVILEPLLFHYLENQVRDSILEASASEHSARMIAMKNATDNAKEFTNILTLEYNRIRQEKITYEIADTVTARLAVT
ncbi:MAG: ATP synthase F1 subunit gamma [Patescibacteria group bacterium]